MSTNPGLSNQAGVRTTFRIVGPILAVVGIVVCISGFVSFTKYDGDTAPLRQMAMFMGGFVVFALGMGMARAGFMGVGARYAVGELAPVAKDGLGYLTGGQGATTATGPFCRACGTRNDDSAKFCDSCGASLG
ncbi:zinc ribbon domain-containing protein [Nocardioides ultimimeridianus]